jgi:hypothetical protein
MLVTIKSIFFFKWIFLGRISALEESRRRNDSRRPRSADRISHRLGKVLFKHFINETYKLMFKISNNI